MIEILIVVSILLLIFSSFCLGFTYGKKKEKQDPKGTIHVNLSNPEEEFFHCTVDKDFFEVINGPDAKPTVTFSIVID